MSADKKYVSKENLAAFAEALAAQVPLKSDIPTKVSDLQNDLGFTDKPGTITSVTLNGTTTSSGGVDLGYLVVQEGGKGLSSNDYTSLEKSKLGGIESSAQVNTIETISVNETVITPVNKVVEITVPTMLSDLSDDATHRFVTDTEKATWSGKQNALTFDSAPTENSTNPVTSGGLYTVITQNEYVTAEAINDLEDRVSDIEDSVGDITVPTKVSDLQNDSGFTSNTGTITRITMNGASKGTSGVVDLGTIVVSESDPVFSASAASGITASDISNWNSKTSNTGTLTGVSFNGTAATVTNGVASISATIPDVANYFDEVAYDSGTKRINFKHGETVKKYIDATDFIKDGMVDDVEIATPETGTNAGVSCLVVTFNTDAGKEDIEIPLSSIFNPTNYYTKTEADGEFVAQESGKGLSSEDYTSAEKTKLSGIEAGAQVNVKPDWSAASGSSAEILNKPTIPTKLSDLTDDTVSGNYLPVSWSSNQTVSGASTGLSRGSTSIIANLDGEFDPELKITGNSSSTILDTSGLYFRSNTFTPGQGYDSSTTYGLSSIQYKPIGGNNSYTLTLPSKTGTLAVTSDIPSAVTESTVSGWGFTKNSGTLTGVKVNGSNVTVTDGIADVGTVITSHQDIKTINNQTITGTGNVTLNTLPSVSSSDNGKILQVVNGAWALVTPASLYSGTETPSNSLGNNGDIYLQT